MRHSPKFRHSLTDERLHIGANSVLRRYVVVARRHTFRSAGQLAIPSRSCKQWRIPQQSSRLDLNSDSRKKRKRTGEQSFHLCAARYDSVPKGLEHTPLFPFFWNTLSAGIVRASGILSSTTRADALMPGCSLGFMRSTRLRRQLCMRSYVSSCKAVIPRVSTYRKGIAFYRRVQSALEADFRTLVTCIQQCRCLENLRLAKS